MRTFILLLTLTLLTLTTLVCGGSKSPTAPTPPAAFSQVELLVGTGTEAKKGARLFVNYTGWIYDSSKPENKGAQFDSSIGRGPFDFTYGAGQVIADGIRDLKACASAASGGSSFPQVSVMVRKAADR